MKLEDFKLSPNWETEELNQFYKNVYQEIWLSGEYSRFGVNVQPGDIVVDCGANIGMFSQYAVHNGAKKVYAYESEDEEFKYLKINSQNTDKIVPIKSLISKEHSIKKIMLENNLSEIDFLKLDIEGYEYDLILNEEFYYLSKVKKMVIELHIFGMFDGFSENFINAFNLIEKVSLSGFKVSLERIHKNTNLFMLYASK